ncbi:AraC family transcriptional regulator [Janthinobacterium fluminis]|uniref:AraC family transcriptional regulator ligand-binding domain-containing protein n=1 Tax=Janthinobacterium fluminis TaxID=2987524 RepID=A0ABT5K2P2_9BURK|nr:AraC family transcriptional regulator [Janthinobacterium fluminis]MDC8758546.1 AraC family transcriptional regulator ligand-binding domain-containing protein [Janthinobacterium fluminis]
MPSAPAKAPRGRVAGSYLLPLLEAAAARGVDAAALARAAGLPERALCPLPEALAADDYVRLLDIGAELAGDPHFGLHVGERVKLGTYSVYGLILLSCRDFGHALEQTLRYEQLAHDLGRSALRVEAGLAQYAWHSHYPRGQRHLIDSVFAGIRVFGNWLAGSTLPPVDLAVTHAGGAGLEDEYLRVLGALPRFGAAANVASFDAQMLSWPVPNADVSLYPVLQQHAEQLLKRRAQAGADIQAQVHAAILRGLTQGQVRLPAIAGELKLSPRTLQRKLSEVGASFQQVLDQARFALAKDCLRQPGLSLVDIAFLLGYQEQSAFHHAFKEWAGVNPGAYREQWRQPA